MSSPLALIPNNRTQKTLIELIITEKARNFQL
jgi:hypothetical protein